MTMKTNPVRVTQLKENVFKVDNKEIVLFEGNIPEEAKSFLLDEEIDAIEEFLNNPNRKNIQSTIKSV